MTKNRLFNFLVFRLVKLTGEMIREVRTEDGLQDIILTVEELRRLRGLFNRANFNKKKLVDVVKKVLKLEVVNFSN